MGDFDPGGGEPSNDFEQSVADELRTAGYEVRCQVGAASFFIDLAVVYPNNPGAFLLGIECDGASYHSGRSARDRDRLRQEILENHGWKIYRIWSTDWFRAREKEIRRLLSHLEELLANDPTAQKAHAEAEQTEGLRDKLIGFRRDVIEPAFPESPEEKCLLRDEMIEVFVELRPTTRQAWFNRVASDLRAGTEPKQVGSFLDRILEMIAQSEE